MLPAPSGGLPGNLRPLLRGQSRSPSRATFLAAQPAQRNRRFVLHGRRFFLRRVARELVEYVLRRLVCVAVGIA